MAQGLVPGVPPPAVTGPFSGAPHQCAGRLGRQRASELSAARWQSHQTRLELCRRGCQSKAWWVQPPLGPVEVGLGWGPGEDPPWQHDGGAVGEVSDPGAVAETLQCKAKADEARADGEAELEQEAEQEVVLGLWEEGRPVTGASGLGSKGSSVNGQAQGAGNGPGAGTARPGEDLSSSVPPPPLWVGDILMEAPAQITFPKA